jgi:enamine deaminase RidA (YjgF/YER057c/UK114 family)
MTRMEQQAVKAAEVFKTALAKVGYGERNVSCILSDHPAVSRYGNAPTVIVEISSAFVREYDGKMWLELDDMVVPGSELPVRKGVFAENYTEYALSFYRA